MSFSGPVAQAFSEIENAPKELLEALKGYWRGDFSIKVHDLDTFETKIKGGKILVKVK